MDPFAIVLLGGVLAIAVTVWLLGKHYPGSGLEQLGQRSAREIMETREALEAEDFDQMLAARNARRRARGEPEVTASEYEQGVMRDLHQQRVRDERRGGDRDLDELLEVTNARRRERGLPERTREQVQRELGSDDPPSVG